MLPKLRQSVYGRLAGYENVNPGAQGLREKLIDIGAKVVTHSGYVIFPIAEAAGKRPAAFLPKKMGRFCRLERDICMSVSSFFLS